MTSSGLFETLILLGAAVFIVPVIGISIAVLAGKIFLNVQVLLWAIAVVALVNLGVLWVAVKLFQRETILTRWK